MLGIYHLGIPPGTMVGMYHLGYPSWYHGGYVPPRVYLRVYICLLLHTSGCTYASLVYLRRGIASLVYLRRGIASLMVLRRVNSLLMVLRRVNSLPGV